MQYFETIGCKYYWQQVTKWIFFLSISEKEKEKCFGSIYLFSSSQWIKNVKYLKLSTTEESWQGYRKRSQMISDEHYLLNTSLVVYDSNVHI